MSTRFHFWKTTPGINPAFHASWDDIGASTRQTLAVGLGGSQTDTYADAFNAVFTPTANQSGLLVQLVSVSMPAGVAFRTTHTISMQAAIGELNAGSNVNRQPLVLRVFSQDGTVLRATLKAFGNYGPTTTEWPLVTYPNVQNRTFAASVVLDANYTTADGDVLVLEVGAQADGTGASQAAEAIMAQRALIGAGDLPVDETTVGTSLNPWFEISTDIFSSPPALVGRACL